MTLGVRVIVTLTSLVAICVALLVHPLPSASAVRTVAALICAIGVAMFVAHGRARITVTGMFGLASALVIGFGGWVLADTRGPSQGLHTALVASAFGLALSAPLMGERSRPAPAGPMVSHARTFVTVGVLTMAALVVGRGALPGTLVEGLSFMSVVLFAVGVTYSRSRWAVAAPLLVLPHLLVYSEVFHGSTGRLRLIALLGCLAILYSARFARWWHKPFVLAAAPLGLWYLARDRVAYQVQTFGSSDSTGLESLLASPRAFGLLIDAQAAGKEPLHWGASFFSPLTSIIPDSLHPIRMPEPFPYALVRWSNPERYGSGFSTAGSWFGEWWWNFGAVGIVLAAAVTGPALGLLDRAVAWSLGRLHESPRAALLACATLAFGGAVADLVWAGIHTWSVRGVARLPLVLLTFAVVPGGQVRPSGSSTPVRRQRLRPAVRR